MMEYFNFRIMSVSKGIDIIDTKRVTPVEALSGTELMEYIETDKALLYSKRKKRKKSKKKFTDCLVSVLEKVGGVVL